MKSYIIKLSLFPGTYRTIKTSGFSCEHVKNEIVTKMGIKKSQILKCLFDET